MKGEDLAKAFGYVDDKYLKLAEDEMVSGKIGIDKAGLGKNAQFGMKRKNRLVMKYVAAVLICLIGTMTILAFSNTSLAAEIFGLKNILFKKGIGSIQKVQYQVELDENDNEIITEQIVQEKFQETLISLSGYYESPEAKACMEWQEFLDSYDQDNKIVQENDKTWNNYMGYEEYFVYSDEMVNVLDQIVKKYGLKIHHHFRNLSSKEFEKYVGKRFLSEQCIEPVGYGYDDGTFAFDADFKTTDGHMYGYQFSRVVKGYFDEVCLNIGNDEDYEEWTYVTKDGVEVLLALSEYKGLVYADLENCVVTFNVLDGMDGGVTKKGLEEMADAHDFQALQNLK